MSRLKELTETHKTFDKNRDLQIRLEKLQGDGLPLPKDNDFAALLDAQQANMPQFVDASHLELEFMEVQRECEQIKQKMPHYKDAAQLINRFRQIETRLRTKFRHIRRKSIVLRIALFTLAFFAAIFTEMIVSQVVLKTLLEITLPERYRPFLSVLLVNITFPFARYVVEPRLQKNAEDSYKSLISETEDALEKFSKALDDLELESREPNKTNGE